MRYFCNQHDISLPEFAANYQAAYLPLIKKLVAQYLSYSQNLSYKKPFIIGINGAQGSGKSTLAELMCAELQNRFSLRVIHFSIDDFYKTRTERIQMADNIHPLFITRGVPGTHDVELAQQVIQSLRKNKPKETVLIPRFDKSIDDRATSDKWLTYSGCPDIIIFEGWCVGSKPQKASQLKQAINPLEGNEDSNHVWRNTINNHLKNDYSKLFDKIDCLILLKAPNYDSIIRWRKEQEDKLIQKLQQENSVLKNTMNLVQLKRFMMHFERITKQNLKTIPTIANFIIHLSENRTATLNK